MEARKKAQFRSIVSAVASGEIEPEIPGLSSSTAGLKQLRSSHSIRLLSRSGAAITVGPFEQPRSKHQIERNKRLAALYSEEEQSRRNQEKQLRKTKSIRQAQSTKQLLDLQDKLRKQRIVAQKDKLQFYMAPAITATRGSAPKLRKPKPSKLTHASITSTSTGTRSKQLEDNEVFVVDEHTLFDMSPVSEETPMTPVLRAVKRSTAQKLDMTRSLLQGRFRITAQQREKLRQAHQARLRFWLGLIAAMKLARATVEASRKAHAERVKVRCRSVISSSMLQMLNRVRNRKFSQVAGLLRRSFLTFMIKRKMVLRQRAADLVRLFIVDLTGKGADILEAHLIEKELKEQEERRRKWLAKKQQDDEANSAPSARSQGPRRASLVEIALVPENKYATMKTSFSQMSDRLHVGLFILRMRDFRSRVIRCQRFFRSFQACAEARARVLLKMYHRIFDVLGVQDALFRRQANVIAGAASEVPLLQRQSSWSQTTPISPLAKGMSFLRSPTLQPSSRWLQSLSSTKTPRFTFMVDADPEDESCCELWAVPLHTQITESMVSHPLSPTLNTKGPNPFKHYSRYYPGWKHRFLMKTQWADYHLANPGSGLDGDTDVFMNYYWPPIQLKELPKEALPFERAKSLLRKAATIRSRSRDGARWDQRRKGFPVTGIQTNDLGGVDLSQVYYFETQSPVPLPRFTTPPGIVNHGSVSIPSRSVQWSQHDDDASTTSSSSGASGSSSDGDDTISTSSSASLSHGSTLITVEVSGSVAVPGSGNGGMDGTQRHEELWRRKIAVKLKQGAGKERIFPVGTLEDVKLMLENLSVQGIWRKVQSRREAAVSSALMSVERIIQRELKLNSEEEHNESDEKDHEEGSSGSQSLQGTTSFLPPISRHLTPAATNELKETYHSLKFGAIILDLARQALAEEMSDARVKKAIDRSSLTHRPTIAEIHSNLPQEEISALIKRYARKKRQAARKNASVSARSNVIDPSATGSGPRVFTVNDARRLLSEGEETFMQQEENETPNPGARGIRRILQLMKRQERTKPTPRTQRSLNWSPMYGKRTWRELEQLIHLQVGAVFAAADGVGLREEAKREERRRRLEIEKAAAAASQQRKRNAEQHPSEVQGSLQFSRPPSTDKSSRRRSLTTFQSSHNLLGKAQTQTQWKEDLLTQEQKLAEIWAKGGRFALAITRGWLQSLEYGGPVEPR